MNLACLSIPALLAASLVACVPTTDGDDAATESWREAIVANPTAVDGCSHASFPDMTWESIDCTAAPSRTFTVGNGDDYAIETTGLIAKTTGTFLHATGVKTETDSGTKNGYSIQLNSNFMSGTAACKGVAGCMSWAQYVYSSEEESAFMQNWLIAIGTCPDSTWIDDGQGDCYKNSAAVSVPVIGITDLTALKMSGGATKNGKDSLVFANGTEAYTTNERDSVTDLASAWTSSEFNIIGDGGGTEAVFNKGSSVTVRIGINDHSTTAPACVANDGTTGETNNLKLGACKTFVGSTPAVEFTETD
jgi:hypothetical protein